MSDLNPEGKDSKFKIRDFMGISSKSLNGRGKPSFKATPPKVCQKS